MNILHTVSLKKQYSSGEGLVRAVDDMNIEVEEGEFVAIVGSSGSGKSTLLHLIGGLDRPTGGEVWIRGKSLYTLSDNDLAIFRRQQIGFIFQAYNLVPVLNVWENVTLPISLDGRSIDDAYIGDVLTTLGLLELRNRLPSMLSGGQQQRVAIARALAAKPSIILADEPTGNLDSRTGQEVIALMRASVHRYGQTLCMITHDERVAQLADRILHIEDGKIVARGGSPYA